MSQGTVTANNVKIWYETFGSEDDPPLLLVMGLGAQAISWDHELCERLATDGPRYVIRFDNRDVGLSQWFDDATDSYSLDDMADDAAGLLDCLGISGAHVVGASMGGMIAQLLAIRHPAKVLTLTSIMSTTGDLGVDPPDPATIASLMAPPGTSREEWIATGMTMTRVLAGSRFPADEERSRKRVEASIDRAYHPQGTMRQMMAIMQAPPRVEPLRRLTVPTLVIHGSEDGLVTHSGGESTAKAVPGARLMTIEGMGHELPMGAWDEIVPAIIEHTATARS